MHVNLKAATQQGSTRAEIRHVYAQVEGYPKPDVLLVKEVSTGRDIYVTVKPKGDFQPNQMLKYQGGIIDARMAKELPPGRYVILEGLRDYGPNSGKSLERPLICQWISRGQVPKKTKEGLITVVGTKDRVFAFNLLSPDYFPLSDSAKYKGLQSLLTESHIRYLENQKKEERAPQQATYGYAMLLLDDKGQVVRQQPMVTNLYSGIFDGVPENMRYAPPSGDHLQAHVDAVLAEYPGLQPVLVPVMSFRPSGIAFSSSGEQKSAMNGYIRFLATAKVPLGIDEQGEVELPRYGGNCLAARGILSLSPGKAEIDAEGRPIVVGAENDFVNRVHLESEVKSIPESLGLPLHPEYQAGIQRYREQQKAAKETPEATVAESPVHVDEDIPVHVYDEPESIDFDQVRSFVRSRDDAHGLSL